MRNQRPLSFSTMIACIFALLVLLTACQSADEPADSGNRPVSAGRVDQTVSESMDLTAGLNKLTSYQASYRKSVQGTLDGNPYETSTQMTRTVVLSQPAEESIVDSLTADGARIYLRYVRLGDQHYYQNGPDQPCKGVQTGEPSGLIGHPAALLPRVTGIEPAGNETVNEIEATRYPLTNAALGLNPEEGTVTGSLWIASQGGYVVKYSLQYEPPTAATGQGLEASQVIEYQISQINEIAQIDLPAACIPILIDIPAMPNAAEIERRSGLMSYYTASGPTEVAAFYTAELPALGWQADEREEGDPDAGLSYSKDGHLLKILLDLSDEGLLVTVLHSDPAHLTLMPAGDLADYEAYLDESEAPETSAPPEPSADPAELGLPPDVPIYPGASNVQSMSGMGAAFMTEDTPDQVIDFYTDALTRAGWRGTPMPAQAGGMMVWMKAEAVLNITVQATDDGGAQVSIMVVGG